MRMATSVEPILKYTLRAGTVIALSLIILGGVWALFKYGNQPVLPKLIPSESYKLSMLSLKSAIILTPETGIIELGIITLIILQILNIGILCVYYLAKGDKWYITISLVILLMLIFSMTHN